jgi:Peptidase family M23
VLTLLLWFAAAGAPCTVGDRSACPPGQFCAAQIDARSRVCPEEGACAPLPPASDLVLSLPVPAGNRVFCSKGALTEGGDTHSTCSETRRFALDLASSAFEAPLLVLASADGVARGWGDCPTTDLNHQPPDSSCNLGLGNVVRLQHGSDLFTQYAHLSAILVNDGQQVRRGDPIGVEGNTGAAGPKHLHFSLHRGDASRLEHPSPSLRMRLRVRGSGVVDSLALRCRKAAPDGGPAPETVYVSDNRLGRAPARIGHTSLRRLALEHAVGLIFWPTTRKEGITRLRAAPYEPVARYWLAVALDLDGNAGSARPIFSALADGQTGPAWIRRWSRLRMAEIDALAGRTAQARQLLERATQVGANEADVDFLRYADYVRRLVAVQERASR